MFSCIFNIWNMPKGLLGWYTCSFSCFLSVKEGVWMTDSTPPSILFFRASGVKTEELFGALYPFTFVIVLVGFPFCWTTRWQDTLQIMLQLSEPGTVWCQNLSFTSDHGVNAAYVRCSGQVAETVNASTPSPYCREDEISSDPSAPCYWETFVKGSQSQGTSFSQIVPEAYTFIEVEMNRIWRKSMTSGDPLLPDCIRGRERQRPKMQATVWIQYLQVLVLMVMYNI